MCSSADFFRLVVELGAQADNTNTKSTVNWATSAYPDQSGNQSLFNFIYGSDQIGGETRTVSINGTETPYILTTTDELFLPTVGSGLVYDCNLQSHVIAMRTKSNDYAGHPYTGSKYAVYSKWVLGGSPNVDTSTSQQFEFYDYTNLNNRAEIGNDYFNTYSASVTLRNAMAAALGNSTSGLTHDVLMAPLQGSGLAAVHANAMNTYNNWVSETLKLDGSGCTS